MVKFKNPKIITISAIIFIAALARLLPHPPNVTPILAMALFGGSYITNNRLAYLIPLAAMFLSDLMLGFHEIMGVVYFCILIAVFLGSYMNKNRSAGRILIFTLAGSVIFFILTNFAVWAMTGLYTYDLSGLALCYEMALPFFRNAVIGNLAFTFVIFGGFALAEKKIPALSQA